MPVCWVVVFMFVFTLLIFFIKMSTTLNWLGFSLSVEIKGRYEERFLKFSI